MRPTFFLSSQAENNFIVTFHHYKPNNLTELRRGDIITKIDNEPVESIIARDIKYLPGSNYEGRLRYFAYNLLRSKEDKILVEYIRDGQTIISEINCFGPDELPGDDLAGEFYTKDFFHLLILPSPTFTPKGLWPNPLKK